LTGFVHLRVHTEYSLVDGIVLTALDGPAVVAPTPGQCSALTARGR